MLEYKILDNSDMDEVQFLDNIRLQAFDFSEGFDFFTNKVKDNKLTAIELVLDGTVIGGCYVYISPNT